MFTGKLLLVNGGGTFSTLVNGLMLPTSVDIIGGSALIVTLEGDVWRIGDISRLPAH